MERSVLAGRRRCLDGAGQRRSAWLARGVLILGLCDPTRGAGDGGDASRPSVDEVLRELGEKYGDNEKKYEALVERIDKAVRKALATTPLPGTAPEAKRQLDSHPLLVRAESLAQAARTAAAGKTSPEVRELLTRHPWNPVLDFADGLQYGSDRAIPTHENGFIDLGSLPAPAPRPVVNQYLFGLQEIVGWRSGVELVKKKLAFRGRYPKDPPPKIEGALPPWAALRVYLEGSLPEISLLAVPRFTHELHARLAQLRRASGNDPAPMDELLAFLDARWNAFTFQLPKAKERMAIALPVFALIADRKGFVNRFERGEHLGGTGDIPFVSIGSVQRYAEVFRHERIEIRDLITSTPKAAAATEAFWNDCTYLTRYRALLELFVHALLTPGAPLPAALEYLDYPAGKQPEGRASTSEFDVPRRHALLVWASVGADPVALADFLHDKVLDCEASRFPSSASLPTDFTLYVRAHESELLSAVQARSASARASGGGPDDFEREFSPSATFLDPVGAPASGALVQSFHSFHAPLEGAIREAAYAVVLQELGK